MTRYTLRALAAQWRIWSATVAVLALAAVLVDVCLTHRFAVTRPEVVAAARAVGVGPAELEASGTSIYVYSAFTAIPVVAIVGRSCVQALRTNWAGWRLAGASPRQVLVGVVTTVAVLGLVACAPGVLVASAVDQPFSSVLTRMASARMGRIEVAATPAAIALTVGSVVGIAVLGAIGPALDAVRTPAVEAVRGAPAPAPRPGRRMGAVRWTLTGLWALICVGQLLVALLIEPGAGDAGGLPAGGGQAMMAALLLAVLAVLLAPVLVPGLLRAWSAPLAALGGPWLLARRSALWRSALAAGAVGLLALSFSFTAALMTVLSTGRAVIAAAHLRIDLNQVDTLVMAAILGAMALLGSVAVVAMTSRSREQEVAVLRCAGTTIGRLRGQVVIEAGMYVGTALIISLVPLVVVTIGEALFYSRAGLPFLPSPALGPLGLVALVSFAALAVVLSAPVRRARRAPIGPALAAQ